MTIPATTPDPQTLGQSAADAFKSMIADLRELPTTKADEAPRLFFPDGIDLIKLTLTIGKADAPIASAVIVVSGAKCCAHADIRSESDAATLGDTPEPNASPLVD